MFLDSINIEHPDHWLVTWDFGGEEVAALKQVAEEVSFPARATIFAEGDAPDGMYLVVEGMVLVIGVDADGTERTISIVTEGQSFGELALLVDQPRLATCAAGLDCKLLKITPDKVATLEAEQPALVMQMYKMLAQTLADQWLRGGPWVDKLKKSTG